MRNIEKEKKTTWNELCEYVKTEILEYDENMKFPSYLALRLHGISRGEFIVNNNQKIQANYDFYTILCTCKICKQRILNYLHQNDTKIKNEQHKINIIAKIIESEINDVYLRLQRVEKAQNKADNIECENHKIIGADYVKKTKDVNEKMKKLF